MSLCCGGAKSQFNVDKMENEIKKQDTQQKSQSNNAIKLQPKIGVIQGVSVIVSVIIGSGIFVSPVGVLSYTRSVGLSLVMWAVTALFSMLGALVYAELGATIPQSGGEYTYTLTSFGAVPAFLVLWITFVLIGAVSVAANSLIFAQYLLKPFFSTCAIPDSAVTCVAILGILILTVINSASVRCATKIAVIFTIGKIFALLLIIGIGFYHLTVNGRIESFQNSFADSNTKLGSLSFAFYQGFWAYAGWNYLNFLVGEMKNPARNLPIAIIISLSLIAGIYLLANIAYLAVLTPFEMIYFGGQDAAIAVVFAERTMGVMSWCIPLFVGASVFGSINGEFLSMSRVTFMAAKQNHAPHILAMINYNRKTPIPSVMLFATLALIFLFSQNVFYLIELTGIAFTVISGFAVSALISLRLKNREQKKSFQLPLAVPFIYLILDVFIGLMAIIEKPHDALICFLLIIVALPIYIIFIAWQSKPKPLKRLIEKTTGNLQKFLLVVPEE